MSLSDLPKKLKAKFRALSWNNWKQVFQDLPDRFGDNHTLIVSGGIAFYFFLSIFPALASVISIYGLFTDPTDLQNQLTRMATVLPMEAQEIISERLKKLIGDPKDKLGWQLALGIFLSIWITNVGTRALFRGVNIAYGIRERRKTWPELGITILFTFGGILFYVLALALLIAYPAVEQWVFIGGFLKGLLEWAKYPLFGIGLVLALTVVYRYAPVRGKPPLRRMLSGAIVATVLWVAGSWLLSLGIKRVGIAPSYGTLAAVAGLMLWFLLSSFVILLGAEINAALEQIRQQRDDHKASQQQEN